MEGLFWESSVAATRGHAPCDFSTGCAADLREPSAMPPKSWGLGQRPGRRQTLTSARCGTIRKPTITATGKPDHNSDNHPKSPDLKVVKPYDNNSVRNTSTSILTLPGANPWPACGNSGPSRLESFPHRSARSQFGKAPRL